MIGGLKRRGNGCGDQGRIAGFRTVAEVLVGPLKGMCDVVLRRDRDVWCGHWCAGSPLGESRAEPVDEGGEIFDGDGGEPAAI